MGSLAGCRILVVEDEFFLAIDIEDVLTRAGAEVVGPIPSFDEALIQVRKEGFELAVIDINLDGSLAYPIADELNARGVPFVFATAFAPSELPARHKAQRLLEKPYRPEDLVRALIEADGRLASSC